MTDNTTTYLQRKRELQIQSLRFMLLVKITYHWYYILVIFIARNQSNIMLLRVKNEEYYLHVNSYKTSSKKFKFVPKNYIENIVQLLYYIQVGKPACRKVNSIQIYSCERHFKMIVPKKFLTFTHRNLLMQIKAKLSINWNSAVAEAECSCYPL